MPCLILNINNKIRKNNMNNLKKLGLTALGTTLIASSAFAGTMDVTGSAGITFSGTSGNATGNGFSMRDEITFSGGGEMDNGWNVTVSMQLDDNETTTNMDNRSVAIDMSEMGTLTFAGHGGSTAMGMVDDVTPNVYGEAFDILPAGDKGLAATAIYNAIGSAGDNNTWLYSNSSLMDGVTVRASYVPSNGATEVSSSTDYGVEYTGYEGLKVGYARGENNAGATSTETDNSTMYVTYAFGPVTVGYQESEIDAATTAASDEFEAMGVTYAVSEELSIGYNTSSYNAGDSTADQVNTAVGFSYTMGSMTLSGAMVSEDNRGGSTAAVNDVEGYALDVAFAF